MVKLMNENLWKQIQMESFFAETLRVRIVDSKVSSDTMDFTKHESLDQGHIFAAQAFPRRLSADPNASSLEMYNHPRLPRDQV